MGVSHKPIKKKNYKYQFFEWFGMVPIIAPFQLPQMSVFIHNYPDL